MSCSNISGLIFISPSPPWHYSVKQSSNTQAKDLLYCSEQSSFCRWWLRNTERILVTRSNHPTGNRNSNLVAMFLINPYVFYGPLPPQMRKSEAYYHWLAKIWTPGSLWASHQNMRSPRRQWRHRRPSHAHPIHSCQPQEAAQGWKLEAHIILIVPESVTSSATSLALGIPALTDIFLLQPLSASTRNSAQFWCWDGRWPQPSPLLLSP